MSESISEKMEKERTKEELEETKRLKDKIEEYLRKLREWSREHKDIVSQANKEWRAKQRYCKGDEQTILQREQGLLYRTT